MVYGLKCFNFDAIHIRHTHQYLTKRRHSHKYDEKEVIALHQHKNRIGHYFGIANTKVLVNKTND